MNKKNNQIKEFNHIAIIMDGNRRWAKKNKLANLQGHEAGVKNAINFLRLINKEKKIKVKNITLYVFSKDNWKRPIKEILELFNLIHIFYSKFEKIACDEDFMIVHIGSMTKVPLFIKSIINKVIVKTSKNKGMKVNLAFNYSSKEEILNAFNQIKNKKKISIKEFELYLNLFSLPDPEIIIRTGGEKRLSDFLLWQSAYAELFFTKTLWPDFKINNFKKILESFNKINRNYGS